MPKKDDAEARAERAASLREHIAELIADVDDDEAPVPAEDESDREFVERRMREEALREDEDA